MKHKSYLRHLRGKEFKTINENDYKNYIRGLMLRGGNECKKK